MNGQVCGTLWRPAPRAISAAHPESVIVLAVLVDAIIDPRSSSAPLGDALETLVRRE